MNNGVQPRPKIDMAEGDTPDPEVDEEQTRPSLDDDEDLQREIIGKLRTSNQKGKRDRMAEVAIARDQRLYFKDIQRFYWSEDDQDVIFGSDDDSPYDRVFNIFQAYGKIFISTFMGARPKVRAEADDPFNENSIRNTAKAQTYERVYRKYNDTPTQQLVHSRLLFTDGRVITRTVQLADKEVTEFWGVLESRVSVAAKEDIETPLKNCLLIELEDEYAVAQLKRDYPEARKKINSGNGDSYERNCRMAVKRQAGSDTSIDVMSGEDAYGMATKTWSYMRPDFYEEFQESTRSQLEDMYPAGLCVVHNGDVYLESFECDVDADLDVMHALPGDGQSRGSIGKPGMALQDSTNVGQNLVEETFDHGIPTTYYDTRTNVDGLNKQREMPGQSRKATGLQGQPLASGFFQTEAVNPPAQLFEYLEDIRGPQMQFVTGQQPALFGAGIQDQKTASGYAQARTMALGQMAIVWKPYTAWFSREMTRAVRKASKRQDDITATLPAQRRGGKPSATKIMPGELQGLSFTNDSDENFPETWTERSNKFQQLLADPDFKKMLMDEPDNLYLTKEMLGLEELVIPGEDLRNNVLADISMMEKMPLQPDPNQLPQQALPQPGQPPPQPQYVSPIDIDTEYLEDQDFTTAYKTVKHWIQSAAGQDAKQTNPNWVKNVRLYGLLYKQGMEAAQQAAQAAQQGPPPPPDLPKVAIPYDSIPVSAKIQALAKAGIQVSPQDIAATPPPSTGA